MKMHLLAQMMEPPEDQPIYNDSWWIETFPHLPDSQMISLYRMSRATFTDVLTAVRDAAPESHQHDLERKLATTLHYMADPTAFRH